MDRPSFVVSGTAPAIAGAPARTATAQRQLAVPRTFDPASLSPAMAIECTQVPQLAD
jgi:hypothetical protein